jgi:hypothetical protein
VQENLGDNCGGSEDEQVLCFLLVGKEGKIVEKVRETIEYYGK